MKVFLSWSGEESKAAAKVFHQWLMCVLQKTEPWMSDLDIEAGAEWWAEIKQELETAGCGIIFVTKRNYSAPWLIFEAGALTSRVRVYPYLVGLETVPPGPLAQFQAKIADKEGTFRLITALNRALKNSALKDEILKIVFEKFWPDLEAALRAIRSRPAESEGYFGSLKSIDEAMLRPTLVMTGPSKEELERMGSLILSGKLNDPEVTAFLARIRQEESNATLGRRVPTDNLKERIKMY